eukprot:GHRQ01020434.1.p1 GENE.GHRQ01020434.1~~GHRQ01020434.1.p1  ORF type:complete len:209 (+),score=20.67 GHRQ01020434.1:182-808(+)
MAHVAHALQDSYLHTTGLQVEFRWTCSVVRCPDERSQPNCAHQQVCGHICAHSNNSQRIAKAQTDCQYTSTHKVPTCFQSTTLKSTCSNMRPAASAPLRSTTGTAPKYTAKAHQGKQLVRTCVKTPAMTSTASPHCHMGGAASPSACCRLCVAARCKITQRVASSEYMMQYTIVRPFLPAAFLPTSPNSTAADHAGKPHTQRSVTSEQ